MKESEFINDLTTEGLLIYIFLKKLGGTCFREQLLSTMNKYDDKINWEEIVSKFEKEGAIFRMGDCIVSRIDPNMFRTEAIK